MSGLPEDRLMQHFDGELDGPDAEELERLLAESPEARALFRDFDTIGRVLRTSAEERSAPAADVADAVLARIEREPPRLRVVPTVKPRASLATLVPALGLALAAAAAVALLVRPRPAVPVATAPVQTVLTAETPEPVPAPEEVAILEDDNDAEPGASIESVDFGDQGGTGTIFVVATGPQTTPVVWLSDDDVLGGARMRPL